MRSRALFVVLLVAFVVAWARPMVAQLLSPGPLAAAHAKLGGDDQCNKCHASARGVSTAACVACHADIGGALAAGRGMHGTVWKSKGCGSCHTDHRGAGFQLVRLDKKAFVHAETGFVLKGAHVSQDCAACHKGGKWMGVPRACVGCHQDPHGGRMGGECAGCHQETKWGEVRLDTFDHAKARFPLRGAHTNVACEKCHGSPRRYRGIEFAACTSCHEDPHKGRFSSTCTDCHSEATWHAVSMKASAHPGLSLGGGHTGVKCARCHDKGNLVRPSRGSACVSCHSAVHEAPFGKRCEACHANIAWLGLPRKVGLAAHHQTPFDLHGAHEDVDCKKCHLPSKRQDERFRKLEFTRCTSCHKDPHAGDLLRRLGGDCAACHSDAGFAPSAFGAAEHAATAFPLAGLHQAVPCARCHVALEPGKARLDFRGAKTACADCHESPHGAEFADTIAKQGCGGCHTPLGWNTPSIDHRAWPLTGAHATARCDRCHHATAEDRKLGKGASYHATPRECSGCHTDAHAGQFRLTEPKRECESCHVTATFSLPRFDHGKAAGFTLDGRHREVPCTGCHAAEKVAGGASVVRYRLGYRRCQDCHADPHAEGRR